VAGTGVISGGTLGLYFCGGRSVPDYRHFRATSVLGTVWVVQLQACAGYSLYPSRRYLRSKLLMGSTTAYKPCQDRSRLAF